MTREEAVAIAEQYVAAHRIQAGPVSAAHFFPTFRDGDLVIPPSWGVYFADMTPLDARRRAEWGDGPTLVIVDDTTGRAELFCYL